MGRAGGRGPTCLCLACWALRIGGCKGGRGAGPRGGARAVRGAAGVLACADGVVSGAYTCTSPVAPLAFGPRVLRGGACRARQPHAWDVWPSVLQRESHGRERGCVRVLHVSARADGRAGRGACAGSHACAALSLDGWAAPGPPRAAAPGQRRTSGLSAPRPRRCAARPEPRGAHLPPLGLPARSNATVLTAPVSCGVTRRPLLLRRCVSRECGRPAAGAVAGEGRVGGRGGGSSVLGTFALQEECPGE